MRFTRPVHLYAAEPGDLPRRVLAGNLSPGGMYLRSDRPPPTGLQLALALESRGKAYPFAEAEVVWSRDAAQFGTGALPGFGVRFTRFSHPRSEALVEHLMTGGLAEAPAAGFVLRDRLADEVDTEPIIEDIPPPPTFSWLWAAGLVAAVVALVGGSLLWLSQGALVGVAEGPEVTVSVEPKAAVGEATSPSPVADPTARRELPTDPVGEAEQVAETVPVAELPADYEPPGATLAAAEELPSQVPPPAPRVPSAREEPAAAGFHHRFAEGQGALEEVKLRVDGEWVHLSVSTVEDAFVARSFALSAPPRIVVDVDGPPPPASARLEVEGLEGINAIRVGARATGTRLVIDLERPAAELVEEAGGFSVRLGQAAP
jgi:hypothetical protein